jgi:hypothetical protein
LIGFVLLFSGQASLVQNFITPKVEAAPGDGHMLLFWDGGAAPTDWTCVSCTPGDDFYQVLPRGNDTYGTSTGGAASHSHTFSSSTISLTTGGTTSEGGAGTTVRDNTHVHTLSTTLGSASNLPNYRDLNIIRYDFPDEPVSIPTGAIGIFDTASLPSGWSTYSAQNGFYARGEATPATTGGSNTHTHPLTFTIGNATGTTYGPRTNGQTASSAIANHTHTASGNTNPVNHEPPNISVVFGISTSTAAPPDGLLAMWDDDQPSNWTKQSGGAGAFNQRFIKGAATFGATGGSLTHSHVDTSVVTSGPTGGSVTTRNGSVSSSSTHTHNILVSGYSTDSHLPPYRDVIIAKRVPQSSFEQSGYRLYKNLDSTDVGSPLANLNTSANTPKQGKAFRLRMLIHISGADLDTGNKNFKLQVAERSVTCDTSFSGETYVDVSPSSGAIRFYDNPSVADGDAVTINLDDPSHSGDSVIPQEYEEANNFTSTSPVAIGEDGMWDFSLIDFSAVASTGYCFRIVQSDNSLLDVYTVIPEIVTDDGNGHLIVFWDSGAIPSGWSCVSCDSSDDFYQRFFRGNDSYGATGGSDTHSHTVTSASIAAASGTTVEQSGGATPVSSGGHTHPTFTPTIGDASNIPQFRQLQIIRADTSGVPVNLPAGAIAMFDNTVPVGWTRYAAQDGNYIRGENTIATTGGSNTHTHSITGTIGAGVGVGSARTTGGTVSSANDGHTHNVSGSSNSGSNEPPYIETVLGKLNSTNPVPLNIITIWDGPIPGSWTNISATGQPFNQRFVKPQATYGVNGGSASHSHTDSIVTSDPTDISFTGNLRGGAVNAGGAHTHDVTVSGFSTDNSLPPYIDVIIAKLGVLNTPPDDPVSLDQKRPSDDSSISIGSFANSGQVKFTANATDFDNPDDLQLCVEVLLVASPIFTNTETQCGSSVAYSGSAVSVSVTISGLTNGGNYHWQARIKDGSGGVSSWVSFGGNAETAADFIIDSVAPSGTVFDGSTTGVDIEYNDGSLDTLDSNWNITDAESGVALFEYSIGTSPGTTDIQAWTSNGVVDFISVSSLNLETSLVYYYNVRATDIAGNLVVISSDGQIVAPTLSFTTSIGGVSFENLNPGNGFTDTQTTTVTTSTNAKNGYIVRLASTGPLQTIFGDTISMFNGGTYAAPDAWLGGDTGYGYTSSDDSIQGVNIFNPITCAGGGSGPCYAPVSQASVGDIVADNTDTTTGTPIVDEQFTITHRVTVDSTQPSGKYETILIFSASAIY